MYRVYFNGHKDQTGQSFVDAYISEYVSTVCSIAANHPVYIVKPIPEMPFSVFKGLNLHSRFFNSTVDISIPVQEYQRRNIIADAAIDAAAKQCHANVMDPTPYLCPHGQCMGSKNGIPLYFDDNHLIDAGNLQLKGMFKKVFKTI